MSNKSREMKFLLDKISESLFGQSYNSQVCAICGSVFGR